MKVENLSSIVVQWFHHESKVLPNEREVLTMKSYQIVCPKCNNFQNFYRYGKDNLGYQKYQCRCCNHQFAPDRPSVARDGEVQTGGRRRRSYPSCPRCGKASFIHHNYDYYTNYRCCDKKCNHSFFAK